MTIGDRIKIKRTELGMTLLELANIVGVREATVQRYESGNIKNLKQETIAYLSDALKTTPAYLMGWQEDIAITNNTTSGLHIFSMDETELVKKYRELNQEGKEYVCKQMNYALSQDEYKKNLPLEKEQEKVKDYVVNIAARGGMSQILVNEEEFDKALSKLVDSYDENL